MKTMTGKRRTLIFAGFCVSVMVGLVVYSPTLYRMFCAATGYGGSVNRALNVVEKAGGAPIVVRMDASVAPGLDWEFRPEKPEVSTHLGEPTQVYFYAKNLSDHTIVARAVYNVTPFKIGQYFSKTECFCFKDEKLAPGESARMPVIFYVDPKLAKDANTKEVQTITLAYTFFKAKDETADRIAAARELRTGSQKLDAKLKKSPTADFETEMRHQR